MVRRRVELDVSSIITDDRKEAYIRTNKGVLYSDVTEVFENAPHFVQSYDRRGKERFSMIGPNLSGRYLLVAIAEVEDTIWRVVSAYWLRSALGTRLYEEDSDAGSQ